MIQNIIFDFDSTIINAEGIVLLIERALGRLGLEERHDKFKRLHDITVQATSGNMTFQQAVIERFALTPVTREDIAAVAEKIVETINPGVRETIGALLERKKNIYVFSLSFEELARRVTRELGIPDENVFANKPKFENNHVVGVQPDQPLFLNTGKVYLAEMLKNENRLPGETAIVGDGFSDLLVRKNNLARTFVYYAGSLVYDSVQQEADFTVDRFEQLLPLFCSDKELADDTGMEADGGIELPYAILLENIHREGQERLLSHGVRLLKSSKSAWDEETLIRDAAEANILGIRSKTQLSDTVIRELPNLWAVGAFCIGTNQIDLEVATDAGIPVFNAPYSNTRSVAELVVGEVIMLMRRIPEKNQAAHQGQWLKGASGCSEIRGKTVGIIGYGHIGSQVSIMLENLGMSVIFYDIADKLPLGNARKMDTMEALLRNADVVTLHVPDTELTRGMIGEQQLSQIKKGGILINSSRGGVVDLDALRESIISGHLSGAAIDVYPEEPASNDELFHAPLQNIPNVILTPHIGGSTEEAQVNIANYVAEKLIQFIETGSTLGSVNFPEVNLQRVEGTHRILHVHKNVPGVLAKINSVFARRNINVEGQILQTRGNIGYLIVDVNRSISAQVFNIMRHLPETIKIRRIT